MLTAPSHGARERSNWRKRSMRLRSPFTLSTPRHCTIPERRARGQGAVRAQPCARQGCRARRACRPGHDPSRWCRTPRQRAFELAYEYLEPALQYTSDRGLELWRGYLLAYRAQMELDLDRWQEAVDTAALILREPRRSRIPRIIALTVVGRVRARRGDPEVWPPLDEALSLAERGDELQASEPVAAARAEAAWLDGDRERVEQATAAALTLARLRRSSWLVAELAAWRRRAGIVDQLSATETAGPYALEVAGDWSGAAAQWRELGCAYEAALALGGRRRRGRSAPGAR